MKTSALSCWNRAKKTARLTPLEALRLAREECDQVAWDVASDLERMEREIRNDMPEPTDVSHLEDRIANLEAEL